MKINKNIRKVFKALLYTLLVLIVINIIGFIFYIINLDESIKSFNYDDFRFFINGNETYNQFKLDYLLFNLIIFLSITIYFFKDKFLKSEKNNKNEENNF